MNPEAKDNKDNKDDEESVASTIDDIEEVVQNLYTSAFSNIVNTEDEDLDVISGLSQGRNHFIQLLDLDQNTSSKKRRQNHRPPQSS